MNTTPPSLWTTLADARWQLLWTDALLWGLLAAGLVLGWRLRHDAGQRALLQRLWRRPGALPATLLLVLLGGVVLLDSLHLQRALPAAADRVAPIAYATRSESLLGLLLERAVAGPESRYSRPLSAWTLHRESVLRDGTVQREPVRLKHGGAHLGEGAAGWGADLLQRALLGAAAGLGLTLALVALALATRGLRDARGQRHHGRAAWAVLARGDTLLPWRGTVGFALGLGALIGAVAAWAPVYHVLGTDRTGNDVLVQALHSLRTAAVIAALATLATVPPALALGLAAGWWRGWVDEAVQYLVALLAAVPNVLLIAAGVLLVHALMDRWPDGGGSALQRADLQLLLLCLILGLGGWTALCRLVRAETLQLREADFVRAARAAGLGDARILARHLLPQVTHLVLIQAALETSSLVLYEAVLTYAGVGVDPALQSFGGMINLARSELGRDPVVWWSVAAALVFMVALVLAMNVLADALRHALDPRAAPAPGWGGGAADALSGSGDEPAAAPATSRIRAARLIVDGLRIEALRPAAAGRPPRIETVVHGLDLQLARGETLALVGGSGSGKSLSAAALLDLLPTGTRHVAGRVFCVDAAGAALQTLDTSDAPGLRAWRGGRIGLVFQEAGAALNPVQRVGRQLVEAIEAHTRHRGAAAWARAVEWLAAVELPEPLRLAQRHPFELSGGQQQRVMIALALAGEPDFLIADEPSTALDVLSQAQVLALLKRLQHEHGLGLLLITHDLAVVAQVADRVLLMQRGEAVEQAPAANFFAGPASDDGRSLLAAVPRFEPVTRAPRPLPDDAKHAPPLLQVEHLRVAYAGRRPGWLGPRPLHVAVQDLGFTLHAGRTLALIGASGSGKSSAGLAIAQLLRGKAQVGGEIRLAGRPLRGLRGAALRAARREVQVVFQDPLAALSPRMPVREALLEPMHALRPEWSAAEREARLADLIQRCGLSGLDLNATPQAYSGGQRQRLAIARALACAPRLLVCDEPTSALDAEVQAQVLTLLQDLQSATGVALLFITHHLALAARLADEVVVMKDGEVVEQGAVAAVLGREPGPGHEWTRELVGAVPGIRGIAA